MAIEPSLASLSASAVTPAEEIGLLASDVLSTLLSPTSVLVTKFHCVSVVPVGPFLRNLAASPGITPGPAGPIGPCGPAPPAGPVAPVLPVGPAGPVAPVGPANTPTSSHVFGSAVQTPK